MLEASPGMLGADDKRSLTIIRTGLGAAARISVTAPAASASETEGPGDPGVMDLALRLREKNVFVERALLSTSLPRTAVFLAHEDVTDAMTEEAALMRSLAREADVKLSTSAAGLLPVVLEAIKTFDDVATDFKAYEKELRASASDGHAKAALKALAKEPRAILEGAETVLAKAGPNRALISAFHRRAGDPIVAPHIAKALGQMGGKAVPALIEALGEPETCRQAILALGEIGPEAKDAGVYLVRLRDGPFAEDVAAALGRIGIDSQTAAALRSEETQNFSKEQLAAAIVESARQVKALGGAYRGLVSEMSLLKPGTPELAAKKRQADELKDSAYLPANDRFVALATRYRTAYGADALFALADANGFRDMVR